MQGDSTTRKNPMGYAPMGHLVLTTGIPLMLSMFISSLYNFVDSVFVSRVSEEALTGPLSGGSNPGVGGGFRSGQCRGPISDILTALTNAIYFRHFLKKKLPTEKKAAPAAQEVNDHA